MKLNGLGAHGIAVGMRKNYREVFTVRSRHLRVSFDEETPDVVENARNPKIMHQWDGISESLPPVCVIYICALSHGLISLGDNAISIIQHGHQRGARDGVITRRRLRAGTMTETRVS